MGGVKKVIAGPKSQQFPVVGVGASAGGLESYKRFIKAIPEKSGMAYVVVQHLAPSHESALTVILQKFTKIPVQEITDDVKIEPDKIYVIPSNKILTTNDGVLKLSPRDSMRSSLVIDVFFTSLAVVRDSFAVGVVLSGTGSDGTMGLKMIREYGGITVAQDRDSAAFDDMPLNAIKAGVVDFILPPEKIPAQLLQINNASHTGAPIMEEEELAEADDSQVFKHILTLLQQHSGVDFIYYKQNTVRRRIARRMAMHNVIILEDYLKQLRSDKHEVDSLFQDLLIPVTAFFRDTKAFETLCDTVFPEMFKHQALNDPIRIWVAGCSTGQEAYSMAICLLEYLGTKAEGKKIQIFASDISQAAIQKARTGVFSKEDVRAVSEDRLEKYFIKSQGNYIVNKAIRDTCVFAVHNFLKDPPFAKMDFISCRNVFIYLDTFLQKKALTMFHYALNDNGLLMLGKSETIGAAPELFLQLKNINKIYSRKPVPGRFMHVATKSREDILTAQNKSDSKKELLQFDFRKRAEVIMLARSPASVVVNEQMEIVHIHGDVTPFLMPPPGKPTFSLFKMAREGLSFELRNIILKSKNGLTTVKETVPIKIGGKKYLITIEVVPLPNTIEPYFLIFFMDTLDESLGDENQKKGNRGSKKNASYNHDFEKELEQLRRDMRAITEEYDSATEELQSANEELQSSNEELQSLNEELETSKEELQSANEELTISNQELLDKQDQLNAARFYSEAIVSTIREPLMVLDKEFTVKSVNASYLRKFNVSEGDVKGRNFYTIQNCLWANSQLKEWLEDILPNQNMSQPFEVTIDLSTPHNFILNAQQIVREAKGEDLILLAIEDVTHSIINKRLLQSESRFRQLAEQIPHLIWTATPDGECAYVNQAMVEYSGYSIEELKESNWMKIIAPVDSESTLLKWLYCVNTGEDFVAENRILKHDGTMHWHLTKVIAQKDATGRVLLWIGTHTNIHEQKNFVDKLETRVQERTSELEKTNHQLNQFAYTASHDLQEPLRKIMTFSNRLKHVENHELPQEIRTFLDKIENASNRMSVLIRDLLNFSRIADAKELFQPTDLNVTLKNILNDFELLIEEKNAVITNDKLPVIQAIPLQMNQLFYNLLGNSLKFSKEGVAPVIRIISNELSAKEVQKFTHLDPVLKYYRIIFKDEGIGFNQQYAHQIFIIFQRLNQPAQYSGTGIGLALSKKIVETHQGEIFAQSHENEGAEFHVILPVKQG